MLGAACDKKGIRGEGGKGRLIVVEGVTGIQDELLESTEEFYAYGDG